MLKKLLAISVSLIGICWSSMLIISCKEQNSIHGSEGLLLKENMVSFYVDASKAKNFDEIVNEEFKKSNNETLNIGYTTSFIWLKVIIDKELLNNSYLIIENPNLSWVEMYSANGELREVKTMYEKGQIDYTFQIDQGVHLVYFRLASEEPIFLPIKLSNESRMNAFRDEMDIWQGLFVGIMISIMSYNFLLFFIWRNSTFLFYALYCFFITLTFGHITGYLVHWLIPQLYWLNEFSVFNSLTAIIVIIFAFSFLKAHVSLSARWTAYILITGYIISLILATLNLSIYANIVMQADCFFTGIFLLVVSALSFFKEKYKPAKFFLASWVIFIIAALIFILKDFGILPYTIFTQYGIQFGCVLETVLISMALRDRVRYLIQESELLQKREQENLLQYNEFVTHQNMKLHETVLERTSELDKANRIKDNFFSIIAQDLKQPLISLSEFLSVFQSRAGESMIRDELVSISSRLGASVRNTINITENLLVWAKSQMDIERVNPTEVDINQIIKDALNRLADISDYKNIQIQINTNEVLFAQVDEDHARFILLNILSNALKFTMRNGVVTVFARAHNQQIELRIEDSGIGMSSEQLESIFKLNVRKTTMGTEGEEGTGFGLALCKAIVEKNHGQIEITSKVNEGTVVKVSVPC